MDEGFWIKARRLEEKSESATLDHATFATLVSAQQASSAAARAHIRAENSRPVPTQPDPLIELLIAGPGWRDAAAAQQGCFNRAEVKRRVNKP